MATTTAALISALSRDLPRPASFLPKTPSLFRRREVIALKSKPWESRKQILTENAFVCAASRRNSSSSTTTDLSVPELDDNTRKVLQFVLWATEGVYIIWLFLLPYAPVCINQLSQHHPFWQIKFTHHLCWLILLYLCPHTQSAISFPLIACQITFRNK